MTPEGEAIYKSMMEATRAMGHHHFHSNAVFVEMALEWLAMRGNVSINGEDGWHVRAGNVSAGGSNLAHALAGAVLGQDAGDDHNEGMG